MLLAVFFLASLQLSLCNPQVYLRPESYRTWNQNSWPTFLTAEPYLALFQRLNPWPESENETKTSQNLYKDRQKALYDLIKCLVEDMPNCKTMLESSSSLFPEIETPGVETSEGNLTKITTGALVNTTDKSLNNGEH